MVNKRTHCMRCGNQGVRTVKVVDGKETEVYTCAAMGHGVIATYEIPAAEPEKVPEKEQQQPEPEKVPESTAGDEHVNTENQS